MLRFVIRSVSPEGFFPAPNNNSTSRIGKILSSVRLVFCTAINQTFPRRVITPLQQRYKGILSTAALPGNLRHGLGHNIFRRGTPCSGQVAFFQLYAPYGYIPRPAFFARFLRTFGCTRRTFFCAPPARSEARTPFFLSFRPVSAPRAHPFPPAFGFPPPSFSQNHPFRPL